MFQPLQPEKLKGYDYLFSGVSKARTALLLPSAQACDAAYLAERGILAADTHLIAVERDPQVHFAMVQSLEKIGFERGRNLTAPCCDLHEVTGLPALDLVFVDLYGSITLRVAEWLASTLAPSIRSNSTICLTVQAMHRGNEWIEEFWRAANEHLPLVVQKFAESHAYAGAELDAAYFEKPTLWLKMIFAAFDFRLAQLDVYNDHGANNAYNTMINIRMDQFKPRQQPELVFSHADIKALLDVDRVARFYQARHGKTPTEVRAEDQTRERRKQRLLTRLKDHLRAQGKRLLEDHGEGWCVLQGNTHLGDYQTLFEAAAALQVAVDE